MESGSRKVGRVAVVFLMLVGWFSVSNHCAIGGGLLATKGQSAKTPMHCHGDQPLPTQNNGTQEMPCCKLLRATLSSNTNPVQNVSKDILPIQTPVFIQLVRVDDAQFHCCPLELDVGPPDSRSFTELVLQRSILAHAPPLVV